MKNIPKITHPTSNAADIFQEAQSILIKLNGLNETTAATQHFQIEALKLLAHIGLQLEKMNERNSA